MSPPQSIFRLFLGTPVVPSHAHFRSNLFGSSSSIHLAILTMVDPCNSFAWLIQAAGWRFLLPILYLHNIPTYIHTTARKNTMSHSEVVPLQLLTGPLNLLKAWKQNLIDSPLNLLLDVAIPRIQTGILILFFFFFSWQSKKFYWERAPGWRAVGKGTHHMLLPETERHSSTIMNTASNVLP